MNRRLWTVHDDYDEDYLMCGECISFSDFWHMVVMDDEEDEEVGA